MPKARTVRSHRSWLDRRRGSGPLLIGHRGASAVEPENSLAAFARAITDDADGVELDVLLCATGDVVVFHDDDLRRLGARSDRIADLSLAAVRSVRLKSGATIPTLEEVLELCGRTLLINVELKASGIKPAGVRALVASVAGVLDRAGPKVAANVLVSSFHPPAVAHWLRRVPGVRAGLLLEQDGPPRGRYVTSLARGGLFSVHPETVLCTPEAVQDWHRRGQHVNVWTVDDPDELRRCADMGIDGIITNDPARARRALNGAMARW